MIVRRFVIALSAVLLVTSLSDARAELAAWDQAKVTALSKQLVEATTVFYDAFYKQPVPTAGSGQSRGYYELKREVRHLRSEARELLNDLEKGGGRDETTPSYEDLMQTVREARENARRVFTGTDVAEKAAVARNLLNQLGPYYDPDFQALQPVTR